MRTTIRVALAGALIAASCAAYAQQPQTNRVRGQVQAVDGAMLTIKSGESNVKVKLADNAPVYGVVKATLADIKPGAFIGVRFGVEQISRAAFAFYREHFDEAPRPPASGG